MRWYVFVTCLFLSVNSSSIHSFRDDLDHVRIEGIVMDANRAAVAGAEVSIRHLATRNRRAVRTGADGRYRFSLLAPGIYQLQVDAPGFQSARFEGIAAVAGDTIHREITLNPATIEEQLIVNAAEDSGRPDLSRTVVGGTIGALEIDRLPVESRDPLDLIYIFAGAAPPALGERDLAEGDGRDNFRRTPEETGIFSINGGQPFSNNLTIEGMDNNDDRAARERFTPAMHAVEEVQVIANQFSAEYGRASGGRINLRLRGGADRYHGRGFYYFRDESLNANSYARNADPERGSRLPYQNHDFGFSLGGPVTKQRVFFFGAYENDYVYDHAEIAALLPIEGNPAFPLPRPNGANLGSVALNKKGEMVEVNGGLEVGLYDLALTTPKRAQTFQSRIDLKINGRHELFGLMTYARNRDERGFPGGRRTLETLRRSGRDSRSFALSENAILGDRVMNTARFQFSRLTPADAPAGVSPVILIDIDDPRDVIGDSASNPLTRRGNLTAGSSTLGGTDRREDRFQIQNTLSYLRGPDTLRIGADIQMIRSRYIDLTDTTGTFTFATPADFLAGRPARYEHRFYTDSELRNDYFGIFAQQDLRPRPGLTLSIGLRWDYETILDDRNNPGPRAAFAWGPFKDGKTVIRGGYGIFYNRALLRTLDDFLITSRAVLVDTNNEAAKGLLTELQFPRVLSSGDPRINGLGVRESGFLRRLSDGFRIPESYQASLGIEHEPARGYKVEVHYVFNRGLHLWRESNANAPRLPAGFSDFTAYLTSRDFDNRKDPATGLRPITSTGNADTVRFDSSETPSEIISEGGQRTIIFGLNNPSTSNASSGIKAALAALRPLRPNPNLTQVEELQSRGSSYYHGLSIELRRRMARRGLLMVSYTFSKMIDDGVVNTSSPLVAGDFGRERALSLMDARHRLALSGSLLFPDYLGGFNLSWIFNFSSPRPFSIGANGNDRNLDDVNNDRPDFSGDLRAITWRRPGESLDSSLVEAFSLPTIGTSGNLPRNAGRGPSQWTLNLRAARAFRLSESLKAELQIEAFNPLNATVFSFGAEFVDFTPAGLSDFLVPRRTVKPRTMRIGLKFDF